MAQVNILTGFGEGGDEGDKPGGRHGNTSLLKTEAHPAAGLSSALLQTAEAAAVCSGSHAQPPITTSLHHQSSAQSKFIFTGSLLDISLVPHAHTGLDLIECQGGNIFKKTRHGLFL